MFRLGIIRHGHTAWNREGRIQGHTDIPLAPDVIEDLACYALPPEWQQSELVSSPLSRATQTAELLGGRAPRIEPALIEMDWGKWEGHRSREIGADPSSGFQNLEHWGWDFRPPGGESPTEVRARLLPWLRSIQRDTVAVCHIGVMRVLLASAHGWQFSGTPPFEIKRKRLYVLQVDGMYSNDQPDERPGKPLQIAHPACVRLVSIDPGLVSGTNKSA